jgi:hypothetical protein
LVESKKTEISGSDNAKIAGENNADCIFYNKGAIHHEFVPEKQTVRGICCKEVTKKLLARVHCVRPEVSGKWVLVSSAR